MNKFTDIRSGKTNTRVEMSDRYDLILGKLLYKFLMLGLEMWFVGVIKFCRAGSYFLTGISNTTSRYTMFELLNF